MKDGGFIKGTYHEELGYLRNLIRDSKQVILGIEAGEREASGIKNLKIKYNRVFGYYIEVTKSNLEMVPEHYIRKQTLAGAERYITEELKNVENEILSAHEKVLNLENQIYAGLLEELTRHADRFLEASRIVSEVDALISLAVAAQNHDYCRPGFVQEGPIEIHEGRHPVIEKMLLKGDFIPNDTLLDHGDHQLNIITGPNMAGKSTYLRQVALITLMAQMGSFVPAKKAVTPVLDRIFTRVGASDDLSQGQSTFMVEMSELANILKYANSKSLVLLDEIGRGTSTYDGLAIAWAVVEYLTKRANHNPMTLFATHYHELTELEGVIEGVKNYHITVEELDEDIIFLRKILPGFATRSYGIQVARLAGIPREVVLNARGILNKLEKNDIARLPKAEIPEYQVSFFRDYTDEVIKSLQGINLNETTPMEALRILDELIALTKKEIQ
jgi:DNA mismatch repair protein MutS